MGAAAHGLYPHRETEWREEEQEVEEAVAMEMMIILDMLRCRFVLYNALATERHTQIKQCVVNLYHMSA